MIARLAIVAAIAVFHAVPARAGALAELRALSPFDPAAAPAVAAPPAAVVAGSTGSWSYAEAQYLFNQSWWKGEFRTLTGTWLRIGLALAPSSGTIDMGGVDLESAGGYLFMKAPDNPLQANQVTATVLGQDDYPRPIKVYDNRLSFWSTHAKGKELAPGDPTTMAFRCGIVDPDTLVCEVEVFMYPSGGYGYTAYMGYARLK